MVAIDTVNSMQIITHLNDTTELGRLTYKVKR